MEDNPPSSSRKEPVYITKVHDRLFIGPWKNYSVDSEELEELVALGITAIVNLMKQKFYDPRPRLAYLHKGLRDGAYIPRELLHEILTFIDKHVQTGKVLVHCASGTSRSGGIVTARVLTEHPDWGWDEALAFVRQSRDIMPARKIQDSILDYLESVEGYRRETKTGR
ncbi:MAG: dual specificity protein phosphatase family protein [Candidatus Odinarchaeota archaeon]